jgi:hypothetical protein
MGRWLARINFPGGLERYSSYSTVTETLVGGLYATTKNEHGREQPDLGSEIVPRCKASPSHPNSLVPVIVRVEPDDQTWSALYCPAQGRLIGPLNSHNIFHLQECFALRTGSDRRLHLQPVYDWPGTPDRIIALAQASVVTALCGAEFAGEAVPYHTPWRYPGAPDMPEPPQRDLYAEWSGDLVCRHCLAHKYALHVRWY